jgi:hypothetical protein
LACSGKKALEQSDGVLEVVVVDVTESPVVPKQRQVFSGKKRQHT